MEKLSDKQLQFITSLRKRLHYWDKMEKDNHLTKIQASYLIKKLLSMSGYDWRRFI